MVPSDHPIDQDGDRTSTVGTADEENDDPTLNRTGKLFGGLVADIKRKAPWYWSDFTDGLHLQCLASAIFMYFGCLVPMVTFGGLLGIVTHNDIAAFECLVGGAICGVTYHLFCGQPLTIISATGPVLVFEGIVYGFCTRFDWYYLGFRFWIGIWVCVVFLVFVAFDLSFLVRYITRFTEEGFATLIAIIFIYEAFSRQYHQAEYMSEDTRRLNGRCSCQLHPELEADFDHEDGTVSYNRSIELEPHSTAGDCLRIGGRLVGYGCHDRILDSDTEFYSNLFFIGTFLLSILLKRFKNARFLPFRVRSFIGDFAVVGSVLLMVVLETLTGLNTLKLEVPQTFRPTRLDRGWIIDPFGGGHNPWFTVLAAFPPGVFAAILMFMDQHIPTVIITHKDKKLKKGSGFHLDLLVVALQVAVCSAFGTPWFVGATILSINHVNSLTVESETAAPGERPVVLGIREQRVTGILVFLLVGLSVFIARFLKFVPMSVLYGVFLYMGVASFQGMQLVERLKVHFLPRKYWEKDCALYPFLEKVKMRRILLFTVIQILCVFTLFVIREVPTVAVLFPLLVVGMCIVRKGLDMVFTYDELLYLDDILPGSKRKPTENTARTEDADGLELQTACMIPEEPNDVMLSGSTTDVARSFVPDALPPAYHAVVHNPDEREDVLPHIAPPAYDSVVNRPVEREDRLPDVTPPAYDAIVYRSDSIESNTLL